jgi:lysozyme family protein
VSFESALAIVLRNEGGFSDNPADPGGRTMKGITQRSYDAWLVKQGKVESQDVKDISDTEVAYIYRTEYWNRARCDSLREPLATFHFDASVNHGPNVAVGFLSESKGNPDMYLKCREDFYRRLVVKHPSMGCFLIGWLKRVEKLRRLLPRPASTGAPV